ncbi:MAG: hypothetical protein PHN49_10365 [Candidatus Omnitrophica bacterium]|nr:hypothetical protein [Candidatus Omnitrophota bacterium]MDD5672033.1 hypothetical protein [Candidatus Omnitrophota bacterium]
MTKKKTRRLSPSKPRRTWRINPKTRVKPSDKIYRRAKQKQILKALSDSQ